MAGIITQGTTLKIGTTTADTSLGDIQSFSISAPARPEIDVTNLLSTSKEFQFGLKDNGTISVELLYDPEGAGQVLMDASYDSDTAYKFEIEFSDIITPVTGNGTQKTFDGFIISQSTDASADEVLRISAEIKISGNITTTPAA